MPTERDWLTEPLETLGLAPRSIHCLSARGVKTVGELCSTPIDELLSGQSWGEVTLNDARAKLAAFGLRLLDDRVVGTD